MTDAPPELVASTHRHLHADGQVVVLNGRFAAWLVQRADLRSLRTSVRGFDAEVDAQLMALTIAAMKWAVSVGGSEPRKPTEAVRRSEQLGTEEAAAELDLTTSRVRQELRDGHLVGSRRGRQWLISRTDLEHYKAARTARKD